MVHNMNKETPSDIPFDMTGCTFPQFVTKETVHSFIHLEIAINSIENKLRTKVQLNINNNNNNNIIVY